MSDFGSAPPPPPSGQPAPGWWQASDGNWYPPEQQPGATAAPGPAGYAAPGPQGYAQPYGYGYAPPAPTGTSGLAIASLVLGILWLWWIGSILAVIFGHISLGQIKRSEGRTGGRGMAIAGLVLGYLGICTLVLIIILAVASDNGSVSFSVGSRFDG